jgi:hypothetical protein
MIKKNLFFIIVCTLCISCGVKDKPEYQSQNNYNKTIYIK